MRTPILAATAAALALVLTACAGAVPSAPGTSTTAAVAAAGTASAGATPPATGTAIDPRSISGPSTAAAIPEVVPVGAPPAPALPTTVTDHSGESVTVKDASRILALDLYGTLADTVVGLGLGANLVGRTSSNTAASLSGLPLVTAGAHELNAEAILALQPTVVLADSTIGPPEVLEQLAAAGIAVVDFTPDRTVDGIPGMVTDVAAALGVPEAGRQLNERVAAELADARTRIDAMAAGGTEPLRTAVLYVRGTAGVFFIMGGGTGATDLLEQLGVADVASQANLAGSRPANAESLASLDPEVFLMMSHGLESTGGLDGLLKRPGVAETTAGQNRRVVDAPDGQLLSFGPNSPAALLSLAEAIYQPADAR